jgi:hypothetical protein
LVLVAQEGQDQQVTELSALILCLHLLQAVAEGSVLAYLPAVAQAVRVVVLLELLTALVRERLVRVLTVVALLIPLELVEVEAQGKLESRRPVEATVAMAVMVSHPALRDLLFSEQAAAVGLLSMLLELKVLAVLAEVGMAVKVQQSQLPVMQVKQTLEVAVAAVLTAAVHKLQQTAVREARVLSSLNILTQ